FYQYYISVKSSNRNVQKLKENISKTYDSWADLELALGSYTQYVESTADLDDILLDIGEELSKYLLIEEQKFNDDDFDRQKFFEYLSFPENMFLPADKEKLIEYYKKWKNYHWNLNIFTFNYTRIIEKILGENNKNVLLANLSSSSTLKLGEIKHI